MYLRKGFAAASALLMVAVMGSPAVGTTAWIPDRAALDAGFNADYTQGREILYVTEEGLNGGTAVMADPGVPSERVFCTNVGPEVDCGTGQKVDIGGQAILPYCTNAIESCIESLEVAVGDEVFKPATFVGTTAGTEFRGSPSLGIPNGGSPSIFQSEVKNSETGEYAVSARLGFWYNPGQHKFAKAYDFSLRIFATKPVSSPGTVPLTMGLCESTHDGKSMSICGTSPGMNFFGCAYQDTDLCGLEVELAASTSFRVTMILSNEVTGWFRGRLKAPVIDVQPIDPLYSRVTIAGESVEVPRFVSTFDLSTGDPDIVGPLKENSHGSGYTLFDAPTEKAMKIVNGMRNKINDTAVAISRVWSINSISGNRASGTSQESKQCLENQGKLLGIVTTNAVAYNGTIPDYDSGYLTYKVAGLHYAPDGKTLNLGTYDMVMRSETARCLYGFTKAPVSATVAVVGDMGSENIATTIVSEKDGWLTLAAYGFTFSEKEIQVRLTQPYSKALTKFSASSKTLTAKQKAEIKAAVAKSKSNPEFSCTGTYVKPADKAIALSRAKAVCNYAKGLDKNHSFFAQAKQTKAASYDGKVMVSSK
ncbi:MAG: hypothetical protein RL068_191 [Actinomycetota bacterium]|jgi:hypothetical protein